MKLTRKQFSKKVLEYNRLEIDIHEYFDEDFKYEDQYPLLNALDCYWTMVGDGYDKVRYSDSVENLCEYEGNYHENEICSAEGDYPKEKIYIGAEYTLIIVDIECTGFRFSALFDNQKERPMYLTDCYKVDAGQLPVCSWLDDFIHSKYYEQMGCEE